MQTGWNAGMLAGGAPWASVTKTAVTVTTSATAIPTTNLPNRKGIYVFNYGSITVNLAFTTGVGTSNEVELFSKQGLFLPLSDAITLYGITGSSSSVVAAWEYTATS